MLRTQLEALDKSFLSLVEDEDGPFWTYRHPTISDAFASYVAKSPELVEIYLRGAQPESITSEVVCTGVHLVGASVVVPNSLHELLADRIANLPNHELASFISYRSNKSFTIRLMHLRPDIWKRMELLARPLKDDIDVDLLSELHAQGLLPEEQRLAFVENVRAAAVEDADDSFIDYQAVARVLTDEERESILNDVEISVLGRLAQHVERLQEGWDQDYDPNDYFDTLRTAIDHFARALVARVDIDVVFAELERCISKAVWQMESDYIPDPETPVPIQQSAAKADSLDEIFRDVDE